jgi:hypothetical protein
VSCVSRGRRATIIRTIRGGLGEALAENIRRGLPVKEVHDEVLPMLAGVKSRSVSEQLTCCMAATRAAMLPLLCLGAERPTKGSLVFESAISLFGVARSTVFVSVAMTGDRVRLEERGWCGLVGPWIVRERLQVKCCSLRLQ